jgi:hypothetical protein
MFGSQFATIATWIIGVTCVVMAVHVVLLLLPPSARHERRALTRLSVETYNMADGTKVMFLGAARSGHRFWAVIDARSGRCSPAAGSRTHRLLVLDLRSSIEEVSVHAMPTYMARAVIVRGIVAPSGAPDAADDLWRVTIGNELGTFPAGANVPTRLLQLLGRSPEEFD